MKAEQMVALKGIIKEVEAAGRAVDRAQKSLDEKEAIRQEALDKLSAATEAVKNGGDVAASA